MSRVLQGHDGTRKQAHRLHSEVRRPQLRHLADEVCSIVRTAYAFVFRDLGIEFIARFLQHVLPRGAVKLDGRLGIAAKSKRQIYVEYIFQVIPGQVWRGSPVRADDFVNGADCVFRA